MSKPVKTIHVITWPEFHAFAKRLGLAGVAWSRLRITLDIKDVVKIEHDYFGRDANEEP